MTTTRSELAPPTTVSDDSSAAIPSFLELEITQFCQLQCTHCYSESGPDGVRGSMTPEDWERLMDQAAALGVETVQFIGGEPTLDPNLPRLAHHALSVGLKVDIYTNLVHVTPELWELFAQPGVSVGFSWYSADPAKHAEVTGSRAAIGMDGQLTPCVLDRFLVAGNVKDTPLGDLFAGRAWREILAVVPARDACVTCSPADSNDCDPSKKPE